MIENFKILKFYHIIPKVYGSTVRLRFDSIRLAIMTLDQCLSMKATYHLGYAVAIYKIIQGGTFEGADV